MRRKASVMFVVVLSVLLWHGDLWLRRTPSGPFELVLEAPLSHTPHLI